MTLEGQERRNEILDQADQLRDAEFPRSPDNLVLITTAWMTCSYADTPHKHDIKRLASGDVRSGVAVNVDGPRNVEPNHALGGTNQVAVEDQLPLVDTSFSDDIPDDFFVSTAAGDSEIKDSIMEGSGRDHPLSDGPTGEASTPGFIEGASQVNYQPVGGTSPSFKLRFVEADLGFVQSASSETRHDRLSLDASTSGTSF